MGNKVTIKDLSEYCQVSTATISRVLNQTGRFSEETRQRVNEAVTKLGYIPNVSGKTLRTQASCLVGVFVNSLDYETTSVFVTCIQNQLEERGYTCIVCNIGLKAEKEKLYYQKMLSLNVCAIIMMVNNTAGFVAQQSALPVVYVYKSPVSQPLGENVCVIETDAFSAGYQAGMELYRVGCRRIAEVRLKSVNSSVPLGRHLGLLQALYDTKLPYDETLSVVCEENLFGSVNKQVLATLASGRVADGYFCTSDLLALALIRALEEYHYRIPEDVKVIGCNDMLLAMYNNKPITSIRHRMDDICRAAAEMMERMLSGEEIPQEERSLTFDVDLIRRETT